MNAGGPPRKALRVVQALQLAAAAAGAVASYGFGLQISGVPLAVLMAANGAFFGGIMVGCMADLIWRRRATSSGSVRRGSSG